MPNQKGFWQRHGKTRRENTGRLIEVFYQLHPISTRHKHLYYLEMIEKTFDSSTRANNRLPFPGYVSTLLCCSLLGFAAGCTSATNSHLVSAPPPPTPTKTMTTTTVTTTPAAEPAVTVTNPDHSTSSTTTVITQVPPALQQEVPIAQPSKNHVWLAGYWTWQNDRYEWMSGHWELPPSAASTWIGPRWDKSGNSYRFYEGYWN